MSAGDGTDGRRSERLAAVAATIGALALAVAVAHPGGWLAVGGGVAVALSVARVDEAGLAGGLARGLGALGLFAGGTGVVLALGVAAAGWPVSPLAVSSLACWVAIVAAVAGGTPESAPRRLGVIAWTALVAALTAGVAAISLGSRGSVTSVAGSVATALGGAAAEIVTGPTRGVWLPSLALLAATLGLAILVALAVTPRHVVLSPRAAPDDAARLERFQRSLGELTVALGVVGVLTYAIGVGSVSLGPGDVLVVLLRGALLSGIVLATAGALVGIGLSRVWTPDRDSVGELVPTVAGGFVCGAVSTGVVLGWTVTSGGVAVDRLASLVVVGVASAVVVGVGTSLYADLVRRWSSAAVPAAALVVGALAVPAASGTLFAPVVATGAALVVWDALDLRRTLEDAVPGAEPHAVERDRLGATLAVVVLAVVLALALAAGADVVGPALGGEPLVVVAAGAVSVAVVVAVLARTDLA